MIPLKDIEAFILAGGKSQRMGEDKGIALLKGIPMISYVIKSLHSVPLVVKLISGNIDYVQFGLPVYTDSIPDKGPMGGLMTALEQTHVPYVLLMGCDMPFISKETISYLIENSQENKITVAETNGRINPLLAIYPKSMLLEVSNHIEKNMLKMQDFILRCPYHIVKMDNTESIDPKSLTNINSRNDLENWNSK